MSRRRMMMQQLAETAFDYLDGYRLSYRSGYKIESVWQDNNTLTLKHTSAGFMGPSTAYSRFIGTVTGQSTSVNAAMATTPLSTVDTSKCYRLTLTVLNVNSNSATDESSGNLSIALGKTNGYARTNIPLYDIVVGSKIIVETVDPTYTICCGIFGSDNPDTTWNFDFDVKFEEV